MTYSSFHALTSIQASIEEMTNIAAKSLLEYQVANESHEIVHIRIALVKTAFIHILEKSQFDEGSTPGKVQHHETTPPTNPLPSCCCTEADGVAPGKIPGLRHSDFQVQV
jgi:hypothetical protein